MDYGVAIDRVIDFRTPNRAAEVVENSAGAGDTRWASDVLVNRGGTTDWVRGD